MKPASDAATQMRNWLRVPLYGCRFAYRLAQRADNNPPSIRISEIRSDRLAEALPGVNALIDDAAREKASIVLLFPELRTASELARVLSVLCADSRWKCHEVDWPEHQREGVLIGITYETEAGIPSRAMGLGPFGSMPVTRRAPYVALALWAGGTENVFHPYRKPGKPPQYVSFADMPMPPDVATKEKHDELWKGSVEATANLCRLPQEGAAHIDVFCLEASARSILFGEKPVVA